MEEGKQYPHHRPHPARRRRRSRSCSIAASRPRAPSISASAAATTPPRIGCWPGAPTGRAANTTPSHIRDLATGKDSDEILEDIAGGGVWSPDSSAIYYTEYDDNHRPFRVRRHVLGTPQADDEIVYEEADPGFFVGVDETLSRSHIVIDAHDHQTSEFWLIDAAPAARRGWSRRASPSANTTSRSATGCSTSSPMPTAPRTSRSSPSRPIRPTPPTGATSSRTRRACSSSTSSCSSTTWSGSSASRACRASSCATCETAANGR